MTNNVTSFKNLLLYFLRLGSFKFGGPLVLVESMQKDLVGDDKPFSESDYRLGLALSQLAPGPLATQLAVFFGWLKGGFWGALAVNLVFIVPSFLIVVILAEIYVQVGDSQWLRVISFGAAPVVIALVLKSGWNLLRKTDLSRTSSKIIFVVSLAVTLIYKQEVAWVFVAAAFLPSLLRGKYKNWAFAPMMILNPNWPQLWDIFKYFIEVGAFVFGSGLVIVPFLYGGVVVEHKWITESQFIDAMAIGMMTPGPVVITVAFIGYLISGFLGALTSTIGIFLPCFLLVVIPAPFFRRFLSQHPELLNSIDGLSVAALGAIFGGAILLIEKNLQTLPQQLGTLLALALSISFKKIPDPLWILCGILISFFSGFIFLLG